ncbi:UPF0764 protein C16orf89 homolog [Aethina tumida]|uniref:UPF0764 protein C16orf89 homolog n=1 Tax=Aethina tumida TaxID=116153 RepID=UPI002148DAA3|nr:UPF0764 protein C16orf89 homolog [Aethina tumida]
MDHIIVTTKTRFMLDNSTNLMAKNILDDNVWMKSIIFQKLKKNNVKIRENTDPVKFSTDFCFENIIHQTDIKQDLYFCNLNKNCSNYFNNVESGVDYSLTHKLLLLQFLKGRKCLINQSIYKDKTQNLCNRIYNEIEAADHANKLHQLFDLFLEQIVVCGYEGYQDFLKRKYLNFILKMQNNSGCFNAFPGSKRKRNIQYLEDGCADHTTGLGAAVLSLYYNFALKQFKY